MGAFVTRYLACAVVGAMTLGLGAPAAAQDMDWTGFYLGVTAGYNVTDSHSEYADPTWAAAYTIPSIERGGLFGISAGANYQSGIVVLGAEATAMLGAVSATFANPLGINDDVTAGSDFQALLLGRAGISVGKVLPYVTAGVGVAHGYSTTESNANDDGMFAGLAYGAGIEMALDDNWSIRGQYLHSTMSGGNFHVGQPYETASAPSSDSVMVGVTFRFD